MSTEDRNIEGPVKPICHFSVLNSGTEVTSHLSHVYSINLINFCLLSPNIRPHTDILA